MTYCRTSILYQRRGAMSVYQEGNKLHPSMVIPRDMTPALLIEVHDQMSHNGAYLCPVKKILLLERYQNFCG